MTIRLPSGREFEPNDDYVGLTGDMRVGAGFDNDVPTAGFDEFLLDYGIYEPEDIWSKEDKIALADIMIERWRRYKASAIVGVIITGDESKLVVQEFPEKSPE